jgi:hypothetical protein
MKIKIIGVTNIPDNLGVLKLKKTLDAHNLDYTIFYRLWEGFYTKIKTAYDFAKSNTEYDYILFIDTHDVVFMSGIDDIISKINTFGDFNALFSCEKACWPEPSLAAQYDNCDSQWKYLNSGGYLIKPEYLINLVDSTPIFAGMDDQLYFTKLHLKNHFKLDNNCEIFQTLAHDNGSSFDLSDNLFLNKITNTRPCIIHGNGTSFTLDIYKNWY